MNVFKIWNNIAINESTNVGSSSFYLNSGNSKYYVYNNTGISDNNISFKRSSGEAHLLNNIGYSLTGTTFSGAFTTIDYSVSNDNTLTAYAANNSSNISIEFVDEIGSNYHSTLNNIDIIDKGTNYSTTPYSTDVPFFAFLKSDIDGSARSTLGSWTIGANSP